MFIFPFNVHSLFLNVIIASPSKQNVNWGALEQTPNQEAALAFPLLARVFLELFLNYIRPCLEIFYKNFRIIFNL